MTARGRTSRHRPRLPGLAAAVLLSGVLLVHPDAAISDPATSPSNVPPAVGAVSSADAIRSLMDQEVARGVLLSAEDVERYGRIFSLQSAGRMAQADPLIDALTDRRLLGHVLAQRYLHPTGYTSSYKELADWLKTYHDHAEADRVHRLALRKRPGNAARPHAPTARPLPTLELGAYEEFLRPTKRYEASKRRGRQDRQAIRALRRSVRSAIRSDRPDEALEKLTTLPGWKALDAVEQDRLRADIAASLLFLNRNEAAAALADTASMRSGEKAPRALWVAGLSFWRLGEFDAAAERFESLSLSPYASPWTSAAGAFWAARANLRRGSVDKVTLWLGRAADHPRTFYGVLARRLLGFEVTVDLAVPALTADHLTTIAAHPAGRRALGLIQLGETLRAEQELVQIDLSRHPQTTRALVALAERTELPALAAELGATEALPGSSLYDAALFPVPEWKPADGFTVDPALIFALVRQESRFNPRAVSPSGARGLMQLMPATAKFLAGRRYNAGKLLEPSHNLELGQRYIAYLLTLPEVDGDVMKAVIAYNAGPGNLGRWLDNAHDTTDPLMFIESLPVGETRAFVERVMTNYWIYQHRLHRDIPSLDAVASGRWPGNADDPTTRVATRPR